MKKLTIPSTPESPPVLHDRPHPMSDGEAIGSDGMVRTQIYLTRTQHQFVSAAAKRRGEPMAAVIRGYIEDQMQTPAAAWNSNPMLEPTPADSAFELPEDAAINHDHYLYGAPKKYVKRRGHWVLPKVNQPKG